MNNLKVLNEDDWEEICVYLMQFLVFKNTECHVQYQRYGRRGERQHGVDLIPINGDYGFYAQCKHKSMAVLTANEILEDLNKTELFPHKIKKFVVLTTSNRDTSVQNQFVIQQYIHKNSNNPEGFPVHIIYWETVSDLTWLPTLFQTRFFPSLFKNIFINQQDPIESILALKAVIPKYLNENNILWLENWKFREKIFIYSKDYDPFYDLYIDYDRTKNNIELAQGHRAELSKALLGGEDIFRSLEELYMHVHSQMQGQWDQYQNDCLVVYGDPTFVSSYLIRLEQLAKNLAGVLRLYVFSQ